LKENVSAKVDEKLFVHDAEKNLYSAILSVRFSENYEKYLEDLIGINQNVSKFFEDVLVMDNDEKVKNNRLALLSELKNKYIMLTDFAKLNV